MVKHSDIIKRVGAKKLHEALEAQGLTIRSGAVQKWADRESIPGPYWQIIVKLNFSTLNELAGAASIVPDLPAPHDVDATAPQNGYPQTESEKGNLVSAVPQLGEPETVGGARP